MKAGKFRDMSLEELENEGRNLTQQLFRLRFQKATGQLENPFKIRHVRKDLARVRTILGERSTGGMLSQDG